MFGLQYSMERGGKLSILKNVKSKFNKGRKGLFSIYNSKQTNLCLLTDGSYLWLFLGPSRDHPYPFLDQNLSLYHGHDPCIYLSPFPFRVRGPAIALCWYRLYVLCFLELVHLLYLPQPECSLYHRHSLSNLAIYHFLLLSARLLNRD